MSNDLFGFVALIVILGVAAVAFAPAFGTGGEPIGVENESVTVEYDTPQSVSESGLAYSDRVSVHNNDGEELDRRTDYRWNESSGEVTFLNTSATTDGDDAAISYEYRAETEQTETVGTILSWLMEVLTWGLFLLAGGYVFREIT